MWVVSEARGLASLVAVVVMRQYATQRMALSSFVLYKLCSRGHNVIAWMIAFVVRAVRQRYARLLSQTSLAACCGVADESLLCHARLLMSQSEASHFHQMSSTTSCS